MANAVKQEMSFTLHGLGVSNGIAIGYAHLMSHATLEVAHLTLRARDVEAEIDRFDAALAAVRVELAEIRDDVLHAPAELGAFVDLHAMFLNDPELIEVPKNIIRERQCNAEWALLQQMEYLVAQFNAFEDPYLRERKDDVRQVTERIVKELLGRPARLVPRKNKNIPDDKTIAVAHDLSPADLITFKKRHFASFITDVGGATSHTAIMARSLGIPAILSLHAARNLIRDDELIIVDGLRGVVIVSPDPTVLEEYRLRQSSIELERSKLKLIKSTRTSTLDGVEVALHANIEFPDDVESALENGAEGIGLFRTEFLFLNRGEQPTEDEQYEAYRQVVKGMHGRPVTIRTFDLGADKTLVDRDRMPTNPALGRRAIRLSLAEPQMFQVQLRAILRASRFGPVKLLIPMLAHLSEIEAVLAGVKRAKETLKDDRIAFDNNIPIGGMIEIPAAALAIGPFLRHLQFLSIGTNDLIQYTLAIDRLDEEVTSLYEPLHPAVLLLISHTLSNAKKAGIPVSLCGEMAGDETLTRMLLGLGLREFSMHAKQILSVKQQILKSSIEGITPQVKRLLRHDDPQKIHDQLKKINSSLPTPVYSTSPTKPDVKTSR